MTPRRARAGLWLLVALGGWLVAINTWKYLHSFHAAFYDYGLLRSMITNTAAADPVPFRPADRMVSHLGMHWHPILWGVVPIQKLLPFDDLYAYLMAVGWFAMILAGGWLIHRETGSLGLAALGGVGLFFNVYSRRMFYGGHWEHLQVPFVLLAAAAFLAGRHGWFAAAIACACAVREDAALYAACTSLGFALIAPTRPSRRVALVCAAGAAVWFALAWWVFIPMYRPPGEAVQDVLLAQRYGRGATPGAMLADLIRHPLDPVHAIVRWHVVKLLAGFAFLPLANPGWFGLTCVPPLLVLGLSKEPDYFLFRYYNASAFMGPMIIGVVLGLRRILGRRPGGTRRRRAGWALAALALLGSIEPPARRYWADLYGFGLTPSSRPFPVTARARAVRSVLQKYPWNGRSVAAGFRTFIHVPAARNGWFYPLWPAVKPDLVVLDREYDGRIQSEIGGVPHPGALAAQLIQVGYRRTEPFPGLLIFERPPTMIDR